MTQAPILFDAVIINAGVVDILHRQRVDKTGRGIQDLGDVNDPIDFDFIHQWSPMEKVLSSPDDNGNRNGTLYPPVLLTAGNKDDSVNYSQSLKMAAALQYAASRPGKATGMGTHLRIISNLGHGGNISAKQKAAVELERWLWSVWMGRLLQASGICIGFVDTLFRTPAQNKPVEHLDF
ncbi:hypothetical protein H2200_008198 [Cladophialophora chaetospira]|uniref:Peptidase S9 prolyl oligopeptidase catalytic domain-containing protein n=1 Tax=Cladophialophora chaetospira TaxID=386627 RepID=A0AA38X5G1_9EURO|nr:hypothetical protein H2200_008198 [Cladophialophora chaetospira]